MSSYGHVFYCLVAGLIWFARPYSCIPRTREFIGRDEQVPAAGEVHSTNQRVGAAQAASMTGCMGKTA